MATIKYSDSEAKDIFRNNNVWPQCTQKWHCSRDQYWIRAQPVGKGMKQTTGPRLHTPGQDLFKTQPDALWLLFHRDEYVDAIVFEHCGSIQNLNDKRSRFLQAAFSFLVVVPVRWMEETIGIQGGGRKERWKIIGLPHCPTQNKDVPLRFARAVFTIPDKYYKNWIGNNVPSSHEFFMRHQSIRSGNSTKMQEFLRRLSMRVHFYTDK